MLIILKGNEYYISGEDNNVTEAETSSDFPKRNGNEVSVLVTLSDSSCPAHKTLKNTTNTVITNTWKK